MEIRLSIPFNYLGKAGVLHVHNRDNPGPAASGFDALDVPFDKELCRMYPELQAWVEYDGTGYRMAMAMLQIVKREETHWDNSKSVSFEVDCPDAIAPYFSVGYPPAMYDAPCCNLNNCQHVRWTAETFLVSFPNRMNRNQVRCLAAFDWGYEEWKNAGKLFVKGFEVRELKKDAWEKHQSFLSKEYPSIQFV